MMIITTSLIIKENYIQIDFNFQQELVIVIVVVVAITKLIDG